MSSEIGMSLMAPGMASGIGFTTANHSGIGTVQSGGSVNKAWEDEKRSERRQLAKCVAFVLLYLALGVVVFMSFEAHGDGTPWSLIDSLYFTVMTFTTVGYGDFGPAQPGIKLFTGAFALVGVTLIGGMLGIIAGAVLNALQHEVDGANASGDGRVKTEAEKLAIVESRFAAKRNAVLKDGGYVIAVLVAGMLLFHSVGHPGDEDDPHAAVAGGELGEEIMNLFYAAAITATSVGYGDYNFSSQTGRALGSIYATVAVLVTSNFIGGVSGYIVFVEQEKIIQRKLKRELTPDDVVAMDEDGDGEVSRMEFLTKMLVRLGRAEQQDIDEILAQFDVLDEDRSGTLDMNDIVEGLKKQEQREQREQWEQPQHQLAMPP